MADDRPFMNSCVDGLTAEASTATTPALKPRFGMAAYVLSGVRTARRFEPVGLTVDCYDSDGEIIRRTGLSLSTRPRAVRMPVGDAYDPSPDR